MKEMKKMIKFLKEKGASVSIEMCGMLMLFTIFLILSADVGKLIKTQNSLEKISYSLAGIIRERSYLYSAKLVNDKDIDELFKIALVLNKKTLDKELGLIVECLEPNKSGDMNYKSYKKGEVECKLDTSLKDASNLNFITKFDTHTSLYKVTLCAKNDDLFMPINGISLKALEPLASSIVYGR